MNAPKPLPTQARLVLPAPPPTVVQGRRSKGYRGLGSAVRGPQRQPGTRRPTGAGKDSLPLPRRAPEVPSDRHPPPPAPFLHWQEQINK